MTSVFNTIQAANDATEAAIMAAAKTLETAREAVNQCELILEELYSAKTELRMTAEKLGFVPVAVRTHDGPCDDPECLGHTINGHYPQVHGEWNITGEPLPQRQPQGIMP